MRVKLLPMILLAVLSSGALASTSATGLVAAARSQVGVTPPWKKKRKSPASKAKPKRVTKAKSA